MSQANVTIPPAVAEPAQPAAAAAPAVAPVAPAPAAVPIAPAAVPAATAVPPASGDPDWFKPRLQRERAKALKDAGFETEEEAKAAAATLRAQRESEKQTAQKLAERDAELAKIRSRTEQLEASNREYAARMMIGLTDAQKKAVADIAGEDAAAQIRAITALTPTWAKEEAAKAEAAQATAVAAAPASAPAPAPAAPAAPAGGNTAPGRVAPVGGESSPPNHKAAYESLAARNPFAAAQYGLANAEEVYKPTA